MNVRTLKGLLERYGDDQEVMCIGYDGNPYPLDGFESYAVQGAKLLASPRPHRITNKEKHSV